MAARAFWKGYLKVALVNCPVAMSPATGAGEKLRFHTINRKTGNRVEARSFDSVTDEPVPEEEEVKGYPISEDRFVMLEDEEIAAVALESTRTIDIDCFVPKESIEAIWLDQPHYLAPDDKVGEEAFAVIRAAMAETGTVGISRLVLYRRERAVMLVPEGKGIILWTLRYGDEVRPEEDYAPDGSRKAAPGKELVKMVGQLIEARKKPWSVKMVEDPVEERLGEIVEAKKKASKPKRKAKPKTAEAEKGDNVISILDALKRSIASEKKKI